MSKSFGLILFLAWSSAQAKDLDTVYDIRNTTKGSVQGILNQTNSCREWRGVFFAADTSGANRFMPPVERKPWAPDILDATNFAAGCPQIHHNPDVPTNQSEDCLNLNIFAPARCATVGECDLPVLIWYHGGTFTEGWSEGPFDLYDGCNLAEGSDVIVVTANYRLGSFGFIVTNEGEDEYNLKGNQGMKDQKAAMQWVQDNIANFGGDTDRVTIFGQSAGSMSVGLHYTSEEMYTSGLFRRVIMESNYPGSNIHTLQEASKLGNSYCEAVGCWSGPPETGSCDVTCMQAATMEDSIQAWNKAAGAVLPWVYDNIFDYNLLDGAMSFAPVIDNEFITCKITECLEQGNFNETIDVMFGTNSGDGATFVYYITVPIPYWSYELAVDVIWAEPSGTGQSIIDQYSSTYPNTTEDGREPMAQVTNDYLFRCSSEVYGREVTAKGGNVYEYIFDYVYSDAYLFPLFGLPDICEDIACHSEEIVFVYNNTVPSLNASFTPFEKSLATRMGAWWANFAHYGNPNGDGVNKLSDDFPEWPAFDATSRQAMHISENSYIDTDGVDLCAGFWDGIGYLY